MASIEINQVLRATDAEDSAVKADMRLRYFDLDPQMVVAIQATSKPMLDELFALGQAGADQKVSA